MNNESKDDVQSQPDTVQQLVQPQTQPVPQYQQMPPQQYSQYQQVPPYIGQHSNLQRSSKKEQKGDINKYLLPIIMLLLILGAIVAFFSPFFSTTLTIEGLGSQTEKIMPLDLLKYKSIKDLAENSNLNAESLKYYIEAGDALLINSAGFAYIAAIVIAAVALLTLLIGAYDMFEKKFTMKSLLSVSGKKVMLLLVFAVSITLLLVFVEIVFLFYMTDLPKAEGGISYGIGVLPALIICAIATVAAAYMAIGHKPSWDYGLPTAEQLEDEEAMKSYYKARKKLTIFLVIFVYLLIQFIPILVWVM